MVEFRSSCARIQPDDDDGGHGQDYEDHRASDILNLAHAYRKATDMDNVDVMNAMAELTPEKLGNLIFFGVPANWFVKAWPILTAMPSGSDDGSLENAGNIPRDWREYVGSIRNAELVVNAEREVSDDEDDRKPAAVPDMNGHSIGAAVATNASNFERTKAKMDLALRKKAQKQQMTHKMKPGLVFCSDYFFLGRNAWELVKSKFGHDGYEICRSSCKATTPPSDATEEGSIAIALLPGEGAHVAAASTSTTAEAEVETIGIPGGGRFSYEKIIPRMLAEDREREGPQIHDEAGNGHVVSWADDRDVGESKVEDEPIILLPASSTPINRPNSSPLFTDRMNDMDLDSNTDKDSTCADGVQVSGRKRLAQGLSNLGNTCFMNSTLQCLANTDEIRKYFLSGDYEQDLNRDNPLGTGGELAIQFAKLLSEMWGVSKKRRSIMGNNDYSNGNSYSSWSNAVFPREFKTVVGRHAEQFMGYDQHDSQEFATYLLDALHEDTNRVTKKPYIEKPEQEEDEPDDVAADKAWQLHLQREDSRVLENFMGQVKSRLECCEEGCNRVSTTFDPFMYLSVPVPGSTERKIDVTFVPLEPSKRRQTLTVTVSKLGKISDLLEKTSEMLVESGFCSEPLALQDLCATDVWHKAVYKYYKVDADVGEISENDTTVVYQLEPLKNIRSASTTEDNEAVPSWESKTTHRVKLDVQKMTELHQNDKWLDTLLDNYVKHRSGAAHQINKADNSVRMEFHQKLENFLNACHEVLHKEEPSGLKRAREDVDDDDSENVKMNDDGEGGETENVIQGLVERSDASESFCNVRTKRDFAILEFCANMLRKMILGQIKKTTAGDGNVVIFQLQVVGNGTYDAKSLTAPLVLRVPCSMTVFEFRELLAERLSRSLNAVHSADDFEKALNNQEMSSGEATNEATQTSPGEPATESSDALSQVVQSETPEPSNLLIMRRAAIKWDRSGYNARSLRRYSAKPLGMVLLDDSSANLADESDEAEQVSMGTVAQEGLAGVEWSDDYRAKVFDIDEFESEEPLKVNLQDSSQEESKQETITVMDCIKKYCQKEQLEDSEMWYCNKCENHVKAWKQFHLHRAPPYLIIHLKRFFFASSRRREKISEFIDFPLEGLDLTELVADYQEDSKPIYDCYAVSNHIGGLGGGHYTAYIWSDDDGSWSYYNDSSVSENVDPTRVVSAEAYVLYYRRRDVPVGQDRAYRFPASPRHASPMICDRADSPLVGPDNAQTGDMDATLDDAVSNSSSGVATSPMGSVDQQDDHEEDLFADNEQEPEEAFPLQ